MFVFHWSHKSHRNSSKMLIILATLALVGFAFAFNHLKNIRAQWIKLQNVPCLPHHPILGHGKSFLGKTPPEILSTIWNAQKDLGRVVKYNLLENIVLTISDPKVAEVRLSGNL